MSKTKKQKSAFTLIEMLVVIAIIGILTALMVTSFMRSQMNAKDTRRMSNVENVRGAISMYYSIKGTWPSSMDSWDTLLAELSGTEGLIDSIDNEEDGEEVYSACKKGAMKCTLLSTYEVARLCAKCLLTDTQCANTDTDEASGNDSFCVYIK